MKEEAAHTVTIETAEVSSASVSGLKQIYSATFHHSRYVAKIYLKAAS